jgi:tRNA(Ile)-lysidine synthase
LALADRIILNGETGRGIDFPFGYRLELSYEYVRFIAPETTEEADFMGSFAVSTEDIVARLNGDTIFDDSPLPLRVEILTDDDLALHSEGDQLLLDYEALARENKLLILRTRTPGDKISPIGMTGSKKLQDVFVDDKIPRPERNKTLLLTTENEVLWIHGGRRTRLYPVTEETKQVLRISPR